MIFPIDDLVYLALNVRTQIDGKYVPARPLAGSFGKRWYGAWLVLTGKADVVIWKGQ